MRLLLDFVLITIVTSIAMLFVSGLIYLCWQEPPFRIFLPSIIITFFAGIRIIDLIDNPKRFGKR